MGRAPCCDKNNVKRGPWSPQEDEKLKEYIHKNGTGGNWIALPQKADLKRCGKSCRLRWLNYLRPNIKHGEFTDDEDRIICTLFASIGSRWSIIAAQLPGRTDNDIKNYWNTKLKKKLMGVTKLSFQFQKLRPNQSTNHPLSSNNSILQNPLMTSHEISDNNTSFYTTPIRPFSRLGFEATTPNFSPIISSNFTSPNKNLFVFGGEPSCSSSDGSSNGENLGFQSYFTNKVDDQNQIYLNSIGSAGEIDGCLSDVNQMDYSIEEIKQLISTNNMCSNNLNFLVDEIKTEENVVYY